MIERIRRSDLLRHGVIVFGGVAAGNVFNYLFYVLVARMGGVIVYGEVTALSSALLVMGAPAMIGQLIAAKLAADLDAAGDSGALRRLATVITRAAMIAGGVVVLAAFLARAPLAHFFQLDDATPVVAAALALAAFLVTYVQRGMLQGAHLFDAFATSLVIEAVGRVALSAALIPSLGASGALLGSAAGMACAAVFHAFVFRRRFGTRAGVVPFERAGMLRVVGGVGLGQLTITVLTFYDVPLVKHAFSARDAGLYAAAALAGRAVISAAAFVPTVVLPKATARVAAGRSPLPLLAAAVCAAGALAALAALACAVAPRAVVTALAGRTFGDAAQLVFVYVLASGALSIATVVAAYNFGLHRYAFVWPMCVAACAEITTLVVWHPTLQAVVTVLVIGHAAVLLAALYRVGGVARPSSAADDGAPEPLLAAEPTIG